MTFLYGFLVGLMVGLFILRRWYHRILYDRISQQMDDMGQEIDDMGQYIDEIGQQIDDTIKIVRRANAETRTDDG